MFLDEKRLAAAFFIPGEMSGGALEVVAKKAGMDKLFTVPWHPVTLHGRWAGMEDCCVSVDVLDHHDCLQIYFWLSDFFELRGLCNDSSLPLDRDGALPVAYVFRDACLSINAEVAFMITHLDQASPNYILNEYKDILAMNGNILINRHFGMLYLNEDIALGLDDGALLAGLDAIPTSTGILVFAGTGASRWF